MRFGKILLASAASVAMTGNALAFECSGPLSDAQANGFDQLFSPSYSLALRHQGGAIAPENMKKVLSRVELERLSTTNATTTASSVLTRAQAGVLRSWLNANAQESVPGWFTTALGIVAPAAWLGLSADILAQLVNQSGDAGRLELANVAGTVSEGGEVAVLHRIISEPDATNTYVWIYAYAATLNGHRQVFVLRTCQAEAVID